MNGAWRQLGCDGFQYKLRLSYALCFIGGSQPLLRVKTRLAVHPAVELSLLNTLIYSLNVFMRNVAIHPQNAEAAQLTYADVRSYKIAVVLTLLSVFCINSC